ncbi:MAG TPA: BTAD domain-containing putative transcriptional regulator, partial [Ardenticatenaceae bacterium]|nr:BTAD domain-containing putative transcriptional regulator [Ardenticatenaceae bacterium]
MSDSKGVEVPLYLTLLGGLSIVQAEKPVPGFVSNKARALLVYLAVTGRPHSRESLATLLWGDFPDAKARKNLRDVLSNLNQILPNSLVMTAQTVAFNQASPHWLDVAQFQAGCDGLRHNGGIVSRSDSLVALHDAVTLYNGDLLAGFSVREAEAWGEWVTLEQERLRQMALQALELLLSYEEEAGDYSAAIRTATRLLALAPWQETLYVRLMLLLARTGQYAAALAQYERCQRALMDELGVGPSIETTAVYTRIQAEAQAAEDDVFPAMDLLGNPYKGLRAFGRADDGDFFGREAFAERLLVAVKTHSLVAVIGASGSGKSSVIQAGLLPRLEGVAHADCGGGQKTVVAVFRPGASPYAALAFPLASLGHPEVDGESLRGKARTLAERLHRGDMELREVICQIRWQHPDASEMVLVADQLEELYALCPSADTRRQFLNMLLGVVAEPEGSPRDSVPHLRVRLVLAMRADFMGQALAYRPFADALEAATLILGPLKRDELAQAIEQPACERGVAFESGLVARILEDVGDEPGNLPLLQFALTQLWSLSEQRRLTHATYDKIGGVQGALARHADEVYEKLDGAEHDLARRLFLQFVQPGNGTEDTRRVATRAELGEECWLLARRLADARLVVTGQNAAGEETAEIAHEALIREWGRLREWIDSDRQFRVWEEGLRAVRRQWEASARDDGALLRGAALHTAEQWLLERDRELSSGDRDYIEASLNLHDRERARRHRSRRLLFGGLVAGLIAALFLSVTATSAWRGAETQRQAAVASRLAAQALSLLDSQRYDLALLLSIQSQRIADSLEARSSLLAVLSQLPYRAVLRGHTKG